MNTSSNENHKPNERLYPVTIGVAATSQRQAYEKIDELVRDADVSCPLVQWLVRGIVCYGIYVTMTNKKVPVLFDASTARSRRARERRRKMRK